MDNGRTSGQGSSRRTAATAPGTKPRVPSTHLDDAELRPSDSASNAPTRRSTSQSHKMAPSLSNVYERRTERTTYTTKDAFRIRTQSSTKDSRPTEASSKDSANKPAPSLDRDAPATTLSPSKKGKKAQREQLHSRMPTPRKLMSALKYHGNRRPRW